MRLQSEGQVRAHPALRGARLLTQTANWLALWQKNATRGIRLKPALSVGHVKTGSGNLCAKDFTTKDGGQARQEGLHLEVNESWLFSAI